MRKSNAAVNNAHHELAPTQLYDNSTNNSAQEKQPEWRRDRQVISTHNGFRQIQMMPQPEMEFKA